ncbi:MULTISPECIES: hypothetical protein [unclassified Streptomyces]|nr:MULTISPECIES: hypothetical protein [unclassified Streptomyces]MCX5440776.1 hypothetical protein [Streptomyces sp. NBC_00063]WUB92856.1 hypothetical protein OHO83_11470 [Streptomyces sp. NBC_00569]
MPSGQANSHSRRRERRRPSPAEAARRLMYAHIQHSGDLIADHLTAQH